ncbi:phage terminase small subunit [Sphingomonas hylomeconis]|uniref:Phage terminase small subunit n=1 Tax=Sphingomonas hylomeconis TaxID=1395958 RepID=A0ABV7SXP3_9SPHN|nr:phage terminase small subunit [Sphingomonas hylomeconis]
MSLARKHRERTLAAQSAASFDVEGGLLAETTTTPAGSTPVDRAEAQVTLRLRHDLQRLKQIQSIEKKIATKREMLPEYWPWIDGLLDAARASGEGVQGEVLPTIMVWAIDTNDWARALDLAEYVLRHNIALPARYERQAATLIVEQLSENAIACFERNIIVPHDVLSRLYELAADRDMPDEVKAKLQKALGMDYAAVIDPELYPEASEEHRVSARDRAISHYARAVELNPRIGLKQKLEKLRKDAAAAAPAPQQAS